MGCPDGQTAVCHHDPSSDPLQWSNNNTKSHPFRFSRGAGESPPVGVALAASREPITRVLCSIMHNAYHKRHTHDTLAPSVLSSFGSMHTDIKRISRRDLSSPVSESSPIGPQHQERPMWWTSGIWWYYGWWSGVLSRASAYISNDNTYITRSVSTFGLSPTTIIRGSH